MSKTDPQDAQRELLTAGVRHAKTFFTILIMLDVVCIVLSVVLGAWPVAVPLLFGMIGLFLGKWFFDGIESIILLLYTNGERMNRIDENTARIVDLLKAEGNTASDARSPFQPSAQTVTQDDPAHWPKQEPMDTGINVEEALRAASDLNRE